MNPHERYERQILDAIERDQSLSQRSLATRLGIALGLTNLLVRRLIRKGWVRVRRVRSNRLRYFLTPAGIAERARLSHLFLRDAVSFYGVARGRIRDSLARVDGPSTRVVFYGTREIAEIAYVCLRETQLQLVGVIVTDGPSVPFFGVPAHTPDKIGDGVVGDTPYDYLVITCLDEHEAARHRLDAVGVSPQRIHWL